LDALPPEDELARLYTFSPEHEERMKRLFAGEKRKELLRLSVRLAMRVAATIAIAVSILFGSLMLVPEVRATVIRTVIEWFGEFVRFTSDSPISDPINLEPMYLPTGFYEVLRDELDMSMAILYSNEEGSIITFESMQAGGLLSVDNEGAGYEIHVANGVEYHVLAANDLEGENTIIWDRGGQRYAVRSTEPVAELQKMAESLGKR